MQPAVGDLNDIGVGDGFRLGLQVQPMTERKCGNVLACSHFDVADTPPHREARGGAPAASIGAIESNSMTPPSQLLCLMLVADPRCGPRTTGVASNRNQFMDNAVIHDVPQSVFHRSCYRSPLAMDMACRIADLIGDIRAVDCSRRPS
jgi:hypothetical protein